MPFDREAAVMELSEAVITGDTSLMHLASGVKRPILALFLATSPDAVAPEDCPFVACHKDDSLYDRFADDKIGTAPLSVDYVAEKFDQLMELVENKGTVVNEG
jgi:ADP-heptose:LPS heptosyltransferase